ncbi:MAG: GNAT family N-acetyltransferase [Acidobacteriota bacterium]
MADSNIPFSAENYVLDSCTLRRIGGEEEAMRVGRTLASMEPWSVLRFSADRLSRYLLRADPALNRYVMDVSGEARGVVSVRYPWLHGPYLELLAVFDPWRSGGIGRDVMGWIESQATGTSGNVWVLVSSFNVKAHGFYRAMGFSDVAPLPDMIETGHTEILLRKVLKAV